MGEVRNAYDNAYAERVLATLKRECGLGSLFKGGKDVEGAVSEAVYLCIVERPYQSLGYATPTGACRGGVAMIGGSLSLSFVVNIFHNSTIPLCVSGSFPQRLAGSGERPDNGVPPDKSRGRSLVSWAEVVRCHASGCSAFLAGDAWRARHHSDVRPPTVGCSPERWHVRFCRAAPDVHTAWQVAATTATGCHRLRWQPRKTRKKHAPLGFPHLLVQWIMGSVGTVNES